MNKIFKMRVYENNKEFSFYVAVDIFAGFINGNSFFALFCFTVKLLIVCATFQIVFEQALSLKHLLIYY